MLKINRQTPSGQNSLRGLPIWWKMRFSKYSHIIYQMIANLMYFQKNVRTVNRKPTENPPQSSIAPLDLVRGGHLTYQSVENFVYFQKSRRTVIQKPNTNLPIIAKFSFLVCPHPFLPASLPLSQSEVLLGW